MRYCFIFALVFSAGSPLLAQKSGDLAAKDSETAKAESPTIVEAVKEPTPLRKRFDEKVDTWKKLTQDFWEEVNLFHTKSGDVTLKEQLTWAKSESAVRDAMDDALLAAIDLAEEEPKGNQDAAIFLLNSAQYRVSTDWFENLDLATLALINNGIDDPKVRAIAGVSAFASNDFATAKRELELAEKANAITDMGRGLLYGVDYYSELWEKEKEIRKREAVDDNLPRVRLRTTRGDVVVELFEDQAPNTVANFITLVEEGYYNNVSFFQVINSQHAQTGDPNGDGSGNAGYRIKDETSHPEKRAIFRGNLTMAKLPIPNVDEESDGPRLIPHSASAQFLISFLPIGKVANELTCFGRIIEGMGAISILNRASVDKEKKKKTPPVSPDYIIEAEVIRKRPHEYTVEKLPY